MGLLTVIVINPIVLFVLELRFEVFIVFHYFWRMRREADWNLGFSFVFGIWTFNAKERKSVIEKVFSDKAAWWSWIRVSHVVNSDETLLLVLIHVSNLGNWITNISNSPNFWLWQYTFELFIISRIKVLILIIIVKTWHLVIHIKWTLDSFVQNKYHTFTISCTIL